MTAPSYPPLNSLGKLLGMLHRLEILEIHCYTIPLPSHNPAPPIRYNAKLAGENEYYKVYMYVK